MVVGLSEAQTPDIGIESEGAPMKSILTFVKLTAQGGLLVLLPILLFILLLMEIVELVVVGA